MAAHQVDNSGICSTCRAVANQEHLLECYNCKTMFHTKCDTQAPFASQSFVKSFKATQKNNANFVFICDRCITNRENTEAASLKEQMAEVVASVSKLTKEVAELKKERSEPMSQATSVSVKANDSKEKAHPSAWQNTSQTNKMKQDIQKVTLCIRNDGDRIDMTKVREAVTSKGIQVTKASVNRKTGDVYMDLPSNEQRDMLLPLLQNETNPGNTIVNVKNKCPVVTIRNVKDFVSEDDFKERMKAQNPLIRDLLDKGSEFSVVFSKKLEQSGDDESVERSQVVARVSDNIRDALKANNDRIFMGFDSYRVFDGFYIKSCAKFGHYHADCDVTTLSCGYCCSHDHTSEHCPIREEKDTSKFKCINCRDSGKPFEGHSSHLPKCITYVEEQKKMKLSIPYYAKN